MERLYASETEESAAPGKSATAPTEAADAAAGESAAAEAPAQAGPAFPKVGRLHLSSSEFMTQCMSLLWHPYQGPALAVAEAAAVARVPAPAWRTRNLTSGVMSTLNCTVVPLTPTVMATPLAGRCRLATPGR